MTVQGPPPTPLAAELGWQTPSSWVTVALRDLPQLLNDHAHLERKAASNALDLLQRWPFPVDVHDAGPKTASATRWSRILASIALDETRHLAKVVALLTARGGAFERAHRNPYAAALRGLVRRGRGMAELIDRLLVSALIEARSAERFELLATGAEDPDLRRFYAGLLASEKGHHLAFLDLARLLPSHLEPLEERWGTLRAAEAEIIAAMPPGSAMHSGVAEDASVAGSRDPAG